MLEVAGNRSLGQLQLPEAAGREGIYGAHPARSEQAYTMTIVDTGPVEGWVIRVGIAGHVVRIEVGGGAVRQLGCSRSTVDPDRRDGSLVVDLPFRPPEEESLPYGPPAGPPARPRARQYSLIG